MNPTCHRTPPVLTAFPDTGTIAFLRYTVLLGLLLAGGACTARGYEGPARPAEQVSKIELHSSGELQLSASAVDQIALPLFASSIEVLPGDHAVAAEYEFDETDCNERDGWCEVTTHYGSCRATVRTEPGKSYLVTIQRKHSLVELRVSAKGYFDLTERPGESPGFGRCEEERTSYSISRDPTRSSKY